MFFIGLGMALFYMLTYAAAYLRIVESDAYSEAVQFNIHNSRVLDSVGTITNVSLLFSQSFIRRKNGINTADITISIEGQHGSVLMRTILTKRVGKWKISSSRMVK
jgi:hypothetical protein